MKHFTLTNEHILLIRNMYFDSDDVIPSSPRVNPKRPYGNSDIIDDIAKIIGIEAIETDNEPVWPKGTESRCIALHSEVTRALQVCCSTLSFQPGEYVADDYDEKWRPLLPPGGE